MTWRNHLVGFYSILDADDEELARTLVAPASAGGCGARVMQLRLKPRGAQVATRDVMAAALMARRVTKKHGALLIINDRMDLAIASEADGVHLGQGDLPLVDAVALRARWAAGRRFLIGISTHNTAQAAEAARGGADYLGFGPVFATQTKVNPDPAQGLAGLRAAVAAAEGVPVVAIGGITPAHAGDLAASGAAAACSISAVNHSGNIASAGRAIGVAWERRAAGDRASDPVDRPH